MRQPQILPLFLRRFSIGLFLFLSACEGKAAEEFWQAMGLLVMGLMLLGVLVLIAEILAGLCVLVLLALETVVVILNIAKPTRLSVVSGFVMGTMNLFCSGTGIAAIAFAPPPEVDTLTVPVEPEAPSELAVAAIGMGLLSTAVLMSSSGYGLLRIRKQVDDPFVADT